MGTSGYIMHSEKCMQNGEKTSCQQMIKQDQYASLYTFLCKSDMGLKEEKKQKRMHPENRLPIE